MLAKGLREEAYAVDVVGDGSRAAYQAAITDYDAIILDVVLPFQDGLSVCREIRREAQSKAIRNMCSDRGVDEKYRTGLSRNPEILRRQRSFAASLPLRFRPRKKWAIRKEHAV